MKKYSETSYIGSEHQVIGTIYSIPISKLHRMEISPFEIREDPSLFELISSVRNNGILVPIEIRPRKSNDYEIISGARRCYAASACMLNCIPAYIMDLDDDDAIIRMVDSNIQREQLLPSERAMAYKLRMDAMKRKAGRPKSNTLENSPKISANFRSDDTLGKELGISGDTVRNYVSLTLLVPELMKMVDEKRIGLSPAYQISSLTKEEQVLLVDTIESEQATPSLSQAQRMRSLSQQGQLNEDTMLEIMMEQKKPIRNDIALSGEKIRKYFPKYYSPNQIEETIYKLLDLWHSQKTQRSRSTK